MEKLYDLARGTVRLELSGAEPEQILNFCAQNGVEFWDTSPKADFSVQITIHAADYPLVQSQNGKNGIELRLIAAKGGKNITASMKRRLVLCIGIGVCIVLLAVSSLFVWRIDISGNDTISDGVILRALSECGVDNGAFWPALSSDEVRSDMLMKLPDIAWLSVNVHNSCAEVVIHERIAKPDIVNEAEYADVKAAKSGYITKLSVLEGKALVSVGDTVSKGDTLISGTMDSETADERQVHAMGTVQARTWYEINAQTPLYESVKTEKGHSKTSLSLVFGKNLIKFSTDSRNNSASCAKINKLRYAALGKTFTLPVGIIKQESTEFALQKQRIDENAATQRLKQNLLSELKRRIGDGSVSQTSFSVSKTDELLTVTLRAECIENIGVEYDRKNDRS